MSLSSVEEMQMSAAAARWPASICLLSTTKTQYINDWITHLLRWAGCREN